MKRKKTAGIILHPTCLPGAYGIGELGSSAYGFIDYLKHIGASHWQILPLSPTGFGNSPYSARSTFAGNELLISIELLIDEGMIKAESLGRMPQWESRRVDYEQLIPWKMELLKEAAGSYQPDEQFSEFCRREEDWLDGYALFMSLAVDCSLGFSWYDQWDRDLALRSEQALASWRDRCAEGIHRWKVLQFWFHTQWMRVKAYARSRGISIIGDVPIFVAADSADTWQHMDLFKTDSKGGFSSQSGVPPDAFSSTGQLWGMPVYDWDGHRKELFEWWTRRVEHTLELTDIIRIDHFRGLQAYWEVPAGEATAENGRWVQAPGRSLFRHLKKQLGDLPIIAEDLGVITPDVDALREFFGMPGMSILQFAFDPVGEGKLNGENRYLPHNYEPNTAAYTGTHDNQTTAGWFAALDESVRDVVRRYFARSDDDMTWTMIRGVLSSCADRAIIPLQDILELGDEARMNSPSTVGSQNWSWRVTEEQLVLPVPSARFREMTELYGREARADDLSDLKEDS